MRGDGVRREWHGATHTMVMSEQTHEGDPLKPHGVPPGYEHPQRLGPDMLDPGGPRIWPVSQEIEHGPERSRRAEFDEAAQEAAELGRGTPASTTTTVALRDDAIALDICMKNLSHHHNEAGGSGT